jgi:hypothetical protein
LGRVRRIKKGEMVTKFYIEYLKAKDNFGAVTWVGGADGNEF